LRIYGPISQITPRDAIKDFVLGGINIKKGTRIIIPLGCMQQNKYRFNDPYKFDESRFNEQNEKKI
jgi:cytochrome P450